MKQTKLTPSVLFLITFMSGMLFSWIKPWSLTLYIEYEVIQLIGLVIFFISLLINLLAYRMFKNYHTSYVPFSRPLKLIDKGVFAWSRNPVYLALVLAECGLGVIFDTVWIIFSSLILLVSLHFLVVLEEERTLRSIFKQRYDDYKNHTRRWF